MVWERHPSPFHCINRSTDGYDIPLVTLEIIPGDCGKEENVKSKKNNARHWKVCEVPKPKDWPFLPISSSVILPPIGVGKLTMSLKARI